MKSILLVLLLAACGGKHPSSSTVDNGTANDKIGVGKEGDVCHVGRQHEGNAVAVECGPGLNCCYPCGIDGCDSVCRVGDCPTDIP